jgi:tryptophanyl-tRNA synthetase
MFSGDYKRLKSLRNPENKMSKSDPDPKSRIDLNDTPDVIRNKIKKAVTDATPMITYDPEGRPGVSNLLDIEAAFSDLFPEDIVDQIVFLDTVALKNRVADAVVSHLEPIQKEIDRIEKDQAYVSDVLKKGQIRASEIAEETFKQVKAYVGLS